MVPSITPPASRPICSEWEHLFHNAFNSNRQNQYQTMSSIKNAPNEACGDPIQPDYPGLYIWFNNVNTLSLTNDLADLHELCRHFKSNKIGIAALQELNTDITQNSIYQRVRQVFDEHFNTQCILVCSSTRIQSATTWTPGSTLLVIFPQWTPYVVARHKDELGRLCSITLQVKDNRQLVVYSFYNCCKTKIEQAGIHTVFAQQWHVLRQRGDRDPDPRLQAVNDLSDELQVHYTQKRSICVIGDFNEGLGYDPKLMASVCAAYDLVDVMDHLHSEDSDIPSYARSSNRLNYATVSNTLLQDISTAGLNHYHEFYPLDHRPIYLGIKPTFFGALPALVAHQF
jgi:hypothetical protein